MNESGISGEAHHENFRHVTYRFFLIWSVEAGMSVIMHISHPGLDLIHLSNQFQLLHHKDLCFRAIPLLSP